MVALKKSKELVLDKLESGFKVICRFEFLDALCSFLLAGTGLGTFFQFFFHKCTTVSKKPEPDRLRAALRPAPALWAVSGQDCSEGPSTSSLGGQTCGWRPLLW